MAETSQGIYQGLGRDAGYRLGHLWLAKGIPDHPGREQPTGKLPEDVHLRLSVHEAWIRRHGRRVFDHDCLDCFNGGFWRQPPVFGTNSITDEVHP